MPSSYDKQINWNDKPGGKMPRKMSFMAVLAAIAAPVLVQLICLLIVSSVDPYKGNSGYMGTTVTSLVAILVLPASAVVLVIATIIEWATGKVSGRTALMINVGLALLPFVLIFARA